MQFCHDCKIVVKGSASCSQAHLDQLFVLVNQNRPSDKQTEAVDDVVIRGVRGSATTVVEVDEKSRRGVARRTRAVFSHADADERE